MYTDDKNSGTEEQPEQIPGNPHQDFLAPGIFINAKKFHNTSTISYRSFHQVLHQGYLEMVVI